ncbi:helicase-exonuclease AddAB subunit AddA [Lactobacillus sp. PV037]|uniref:helicase-exonuclease AddAB subunit AddA n=1 Tax=Lactobacillus sp. PV037 TaxID=2594496 RepID=UPI002240A92A|nr:helicase-exonuclease AddAB subunit AddA [Lactobacillus sp. PV037]QNQ83582.1 helicase-exonuclease AddAB subunit AddA [Lactobacillus sp. PV037]
MTSKKISFSLEQEEAIKTNGKDILVSASAGSGKTAVLVERVIQKIFNHVPITDLLIITFTKAAASEMKEKIKARLSRAVNEDPKNYFLKEQLLKVDVANISTIDSFCLDVIKRFYYVIGLDPSFSILTDEVQGMLLKERALKEVEEQHFQNEDEEFLKFYDNFAGDSNAEEAQNLIHDLYNIVMTQPNYLNFLQKVGDQEAKSITNLNFWNKSIKVLLLQKVDKIKNKASDFTNRLQTEQTTETDKKILEKYAFNITNLNKFIQATETFLTNLNNNSAYDDLRSQFSTLTLESKVIKDSPTYEDFKLYKKETEEQLKQFYATYFIEEEKKQLSYLNANYKLNRIIAQVEKEFIEKYASFKREQKLLDYQDMEQFAYEILTSNDSNSDLAQEFYQNKFEEILVDEYQDINYLQESIIQALKKPGKNAVFMVGDVKQSIYGFRQAQPKLFLEKYNEFKSENKDHKRIILSKNYRSSSNVVNTVNNFFNSIMTEEFGGINYKKEAQLQHAADFDENEDIPSASEYIYVDGETEKSHQFRGIINRINHLIEEKFEVWDEKEKRTRLIRYSDIAILTRTKGHNLEIMQEFAKANLPLFITDAENYFQTFELVMIMNYLRIIDNPHQDIPLVSVLRSPIFNFTEPELAQIRIKSKNSADFFEAVANYASTNNELGKRVKKFLAQLEFFRNFTTNHRISELIWSIYEETHLLEIVTSLPNGQQRRVNLQTLYERASSYESAGFKGLYQFINFIEKMRKNDRDLAQPLLSDRANDSIQLMTIHASKGLEFPIVFVEGLEQPFSLQDSKKKYMISPELGIGLKIKTEDFYVQSLLMSAIKEEKKKLDLEEEARILYVALTRARQKLILVGQKTNAKNNSSYLSFMDDVLKDSLGTPQEISEINHDIEYSNQLVYLTYKDQENKQISSISKNDIQEKIPETLKKKVEELYNFKYPFKDATQTTAYQAVSEIKDAFNDKIDPELKNAHLIKSSNRYLQPIDPVPSFLPTQKFSGVEIGTATHLILQYYDYTNAPTAENLDQEIEMLVNLRKLNPDMIPHIDKEAIKWFVTSEFSANFWKNTTKLYREQSFSSLVKGTKIFDNFSDPTAEILVHGTIDGYYKDTDGIVLFDYKTDYIDKNNLETAIEKIKQKYSGQLRLYEAALNEIEDVKVKSKFLVLLDAKKLVKLD